jgi:hypothetical protein
MSLLSVKALLVATAAFSVALTASRATAQTVIRDCVELQNITDPAANYVLACDIDCSASVTWNGGAGFAPLASGGPFTGTFDGAGHTITGLFINRPTTTEVGLFAEVTGGTVMNLFLANVEIHGMSQVGAAIGILGPGSAVSNVHVLSGLVSSTGGSGVAGLVGKYNIGGNIDCCSSAADITCGGGLVECQFVAGLIGGSGQGGSDMDITDCFTTGTIVANSPEGNFFIGGLTGGAGGGGSILDVTHCYSSADLSVGSGGGTGGLIGIINGGTINHCFSTGDVLSTGGDVGGLVGAVHAGTLTNCFWNDTPGNPCICYTQTPGTPGCTAIANDESYFYSSANPPLDQWDFVNLWSEVAGGLPVLQLEVAPPLCASAASFTSYGTGAPGTLCTPTLSVDANPVLGASITISVDNCFSNVLSTRTFLLGHLAQGCLPFAGGKLLVQVPWQILISLATPTTGLQLTGVVPCDVSLCGVDVFWQGVQLDPGAPGGPFSMTQGLQLTLGS